MKFTAKVVASGNGTAVAAPAEVMQALGPQARPLVVVTINGHSWRSRIALMRGERLIGISAANRTGAGIVAGDIVEVQLELDDAPRIVIEPHDLAAMLDADLNARATFEGLPFGLRRKHVADLERAAGPEIRRRRLDKLIASLRSEVAETAAGGALSGKSRNV